MNYSPELRRSGEILLLVLALFLSAELSEGEGGGGDRIMEEGIWEKNYKEEGIETKNAERKGH